MFHCDSCAILRFIIVSIKRISSRRKNIRYGQDENYKAEKRYYKRFYGVAQRLQNALDSNRISHKNVSDSSYAGGVLA